MPVRCPFCASRGGDLHCRGREKDASDLFDSHRDNGDDSSDDSSDDDKPVVLYCNNSSVLVCCPFCASSQEEERSPLQCRGREKDASALF